MSMVATSCSAPAPDQSAINSATSGKLAFYFCNAVIIFNEHSTAAKSKRAAADGVVGQLAYPEIVGAEWMEMQLRAQHWIYGVNWCLSLGTLNWNFIQKSLSSSPVSVSVSTQVWRRRRHQCITSATTHKVDNELHPKYATVSGGCTIYIFSSHWSTAASSSTLLELHEAMQTCGEPMNEWTNQHWKVHGEHFPFITVIC